jgi:hypothetical protein
MRQDGEGQSNRSEARYWNKAVAAGWSLMPKSGMTIRRKVVTL